MAENRNITWKVKLITAADVKTSCNLYLKDSTLTDGKWAVNPPSTVLGPAAGVTTEFEFKAEGRECSAYGTAGQVVYESDDNISDPTVIEFKFNIPFADANDGNVLIKDGAANGTYEIDNGGGVPKSGTSVTVNAKITQVEPTV